MSSESNGPPIVADGGTETVVTRGGEESLAETVLRGLAEREGVAERELDPLYEYVAVDALRTVVEHARTRDNRLTVRFAVEQYDVRVSADERVRITEGADATVTDTEESV